MTELTSTAQGLFASPPPAAQPTRADLLDTLRLWPPAMHVGMVAPKSVTSIRGQTYPTQSRPEPTEPWRATTVHARCCAPGEHMGTEVHRVFVS